jgi:hypothetical protein
MSLAAAASSPAPLVVERAAAAKAMQDSPQGQLARAVFALPFVTTDFDVLGRRNARQQASQLLLCSPSKLVEETLSLSIDVSRARGNNSVSVGEEWILQRLRAVIRQHALPCLRRTDWKGKMKPPHVGLVYVILLTISAADIHREGIRVLVKGEAVSQMFREQLGDGYKIMLSQAGVTCFQCDIALTQA